jgi:hypothetical protein
MEQNHERPKIIPSVRPRPPSPATGAGGPRLVAMTWPAVALAKGDS